MTSARTAQSDRILRECDCDYYPIVQCAHFDGDVLRFEDWGDKSLRLFGKQYVVWCRSLGPALYYGPDYDAALAAFHEAEARLLAGGAE
jgi:hypothetical protein